MAARWAHNPEVAGSIPAPATNHRDICAGESAQCAEISAAIRGSVIFAGAINDRQQGYFPPGHLRSDHVGVGGACAGIDIHMIAIAPGEEKIGLSFYSVDMTPFQVREFARLIGLDKPEIITGRKFQCVFEDVEKGGVVFRLVPEHADD